MAVRLARAGFCYCAVLLGRAERGSESSDVKSHQLRRRDRREAPHQHAHGLVRGLPSQHQPHHHRIVHRLPPSTLAAPPLTPGRTPSLHPGVPSAQQPATASSTFFTSSPGSSAHPPAVTVFCRCPRARCRNGFVESAARRPSARPHARGPRPHSSLRLRTLLWGALRTRLRPNPKQAAFTH
jgi:hypothetical protein